MHELYKNTAPLQSLFYLQKTRLFLRFSSFLSSDIFHPVPFCIFDTLSVSFHSLRKNVIQSAKAKNPYPNIDIHTNPHGLGPLHFLPQGFPRSVSVFLLYSCTHLYKNISYPASVFYLCKKRSYRKPSQST